MATKKGGGTSGNGRKSNPKYLGNKKSDGERVKPGNIIVRQKGSKILSGEGTGMGKDFTIYAVEEGFVSFKSNVYNGKKSVLIKKRDL
ncbi:50S ribosomal protein L27 [Rickettsiales bacterium (ex Bugula neritina AB1)]|nr:50S ribosomal protein L27 [Rickettsiales bacterium (ex Bugula neritina AB1)]